ncbi:MAG TPA: ATP-binding protein [archaeon]|nr:ATP-binding protein [archaeon]
MVLYNQRKKSRFELTLSKQIGNRKLKSMSWPMNTMIMFDFYRFFKANGTIKYAKTTMTKEWGPYFDEVVILYKDFLITVKPDREFDTTTYITVYHRSEVKIRDMWNGLEEWMIKNSTFRSKQFLFPGFHRPKMSKIVFSDSRSKDIIEANTTLFFRNLDKLRAHKLKTKRGIILYGSPGNGKTSICRWISQNSPDVTRIWITGWEMRSCNISELFDIARKLAPSIIFLEDLDTAGISRHLTGRINPLLGSLLNEMDGIEKNDGIVVIATTNNIYALDEALANRPGRFDLKIHIGNPHPKIVKQITGREDNIPLAEAFHRREEKIYYEKILGKKYRMPGRRERVHYIG